MSRDNGAAVPSPGEVFLAVVEHFDDASGLGSVTTSGGLSLPFHCTAITDGSRRIDEGQSVACLAGPGHLGEWIGESLTKIP